MLSRDGRITVWHIAVMMAILELGDGNVDFSITVSRKRIMELVHINSFVTYHKIIKELQLFGYIVYVPSYHPVKCSSIFLKLPKGQTA